MVQRPAVFFDRDGVVNQSPGDGYVTILEDFVLSQGIEEALMLCKDRGYWTVLVTSQRCVGKGLISQENLGKIHETMQRTLGEKAAFDSIQVFTGLPGSEHLEKPKPGLVLAAAEQLQIELNRSWLVGDADRDILMAQSAGVGTTVRVRTHHPVATAANWTVDSISELVPLIADYLPTIEAC